MSGLLLFIETHSQRITSLKVRVMGLNSCYKLTATLKIEIFRHHELTAVLMPYTVIVARFQASSLLLSRCDESQLLRQSLLPDAYRRDPLCVHCKTQLITRI